VDALAPQVRGVTEFDLVVLDDGVDGVVALAVEEQAVAPGPLTYFTPRPRPPIYFFASSSSTP